jgi:hypothetical protein
MNLQTCISKATSLYKKTPSLMFYVNQFIKWAKHKWGKKLFFFLMVLFGLKTIMKTYGWLRKKSLSGKHVYITGAG